MQIERQQHRLGGRSRGITLIELLAAVAIVAVLSAVAWVAIAGRVETSAKQTQLKSDMRQVILAANLYRSDNDGGLPMHWRDFGYYGIRRKDPKISDDARRRAKHYDPRYDKPPTYDVSYHTPECVAPPSASMAFFMFRQIVAQFEARPRLHVLDVERDQAVRFSPACLASSHGRHPFRFLRNGETITAVGVGYRSLGADLSGTLSYTWDPDWVNETALGY